MKLLGHLFLPVGIAMLPAAAIQIHDHVPPRRTGAEAIRGARAPAGRHTRAAG